MKQISKKMLMFIIGLMTYMNIFAIYPYDFEVDGIYYVVYNLEKRTCCVVPGDNNYSGELVIPETVTYKDRQFTVVAIASFAFDNCDNLTSISIPSCVTEIYEDGFDDCKNLDTLVLTDGNNLLTFSYFDITNEAHTLQEIKTLYCGRKVKREDVIHGYYVPLAFRFPKLEDVTLGGFAEIEDSDFKGLKTLMSVTIKNPVTTIEKDAFYGCNNLKSVTIPNSVTSIGSNAFSGCESLTFTTIPNSVTSIGYGAFSGCKSLTSITIPNSVTHIENSTFSDCNSLESVTLPNSVTYIGNSAFGNCESLTSVTIPNSVITIDNYAFRRCSNLTSVMIGNSTTDIGSYAFTNCAINEINSLNPIPPMLINQNVFDNTVYMNATLNVPIGAGEAYKSADGWKNFWNIQEVDFASVGNIETNKTKVFGDSGKIIVTGVDNTKVEIFNTSGQLIYSGSDTTINVPTKGIYIVRVGGKTFKVSI